jgi:hypothetical protein
MRTGHGIRAIAIGIGTATAAWATVGGMAAATGAGAEVLIWDWHPIKNAMTKAKINGAKANQANVYYYSSFFVFLIPSCRCEIRQNDPAKIIYKKFAQLNLVFKSGAMPT